MPERASLLLKDKVPCADNDLKQLAAATNYAFLNEIVLEE